MTRRDWYYLWLIFLVSLTALLTGCETIGYLQERNDWTREMRNHALRIELENGERALQWCPGDGIFRRCQIITIEDSEYFGKI